MWSRWAATASHSSATPSPVGATVATIGTRQPAIVGAARLGRRARASAARSRRVSSTPARSALLMTNTSATSISPALLRLHAVAPAGVDDDDRRVGLAGDLHLDLADADRLDQDPAVAERVEQADRLRRRERQPAEVAAGGHRADEHAGVGGVVLHAHAVAEDRPARERRRRVDREHRDLVALRRAGA